MPVTAKLSRRFYEQLGDDVAAELVDWFNAVDATYKADLKETNDLNWERFKATLSGEISLLDGRMSSLEGNLRGEISSLEGNLRGEISSLEAKLLGEISSLDGKVHGDISSLRGEFRSDMKAMQANLMKWMFLYWSGTVAAIIGMGYFGPK